MVTRKKNGADELEFIIILAALGALAYFIYTGVAPLSSALTSAQQKLAAAAAAAAAAAKAGVQDTANQVMFGAPFNSNDVVPGTGQTVGELQAIGYTSAQIGQMYQQDTQNWLANNGAVDMTIPTF